MESRIKARSSSNGATTFDMDILRRTLGAFEKKGSTLALQVTEVKDFEGRKDVSKEIARTGGASRCCESLSVIRLDEVAWHDTPDDCWLVIYDYVYDCADFLALHPGGVDVLLEYAGRDATLAFVGTGHSKAARKALERYLIGELPPEERIFRVAGGVKITDC